MSDPVISDFNKHDAETQRELDRQEWIEARATEIAEQIISTGYELNGAEYKIADVLQFIADSTTLTISYEVMLSGVVTNTGADQLIRTENLSAWIKEQAIELATPLAELEAEEVESFETVPHYLRRQAV
jgi:hypothetical protein